MFEILGIAPTQDARAIRRAYAAALKQIDQHTQQDAFERLRGAYERALAWATHQAPADAAPAPDAPVPSAAPEPAAAPIAPPAAPAAPDFALRQPTQRMQVKVHPHGADDAQTGTRRWARQRGRAVEQWVQALMQAAPDGLADIWQKIEADPIMQHLDSGHELSDALMRALAAAPYGKIALFRQASRRYAWNEIGTSIGDRRSVPPLMQQYTEEEAAWQRFTSSFRAEHERILRKLQNRASPSRRAVKRWAPYVQRMQSRIPLWFALRVPPAHMRAFAAVADTLPRYTGETPPGGLAGAWLFVRKWWWWVLMGSVILTSVFKDPPPSPRKPDMYTPGLSTPIGQTAARTAPLPVDDMARLERLEGTPARERHYLLRGPIPGAKDPTRNLLLIVPNPDLQLRRAGTTVIELQISSWGSVTASVAQSSGITDLDRSALAAAQRVRVQGIVPTGGLTLRMPYEFKLPARAAPSLPAR
ncbi:energy transducer TonB family protein [Achromobacter ruhlandii]|uniref:energy transducer TonB family protein n=1 Tax=Achromobacter ruhlandii TaxID=72557 RepID=UPI0007BEB923|nr:energy transducer TonB [Achromobacter ruhlandii]